jgi:DNA-binding XRE family transcriptional regulator
MVKLNENIRILRKRLSLTQDQFAQQLGVKRSLVGAYEEGKCRAAFGTCFKRWPKYFLFR